MGFPVALSKYDTSDVCLLDGIRTHHTRLDIGEQFAVRQVERPRLFACHADSDYLSVGCRIVCQPYRLHAFADYPPSSNND